MPSFVLRPYISSDLEEVIRIWYGTWHKTFPNLKHPDSIDKWKHRFQEVIVPNMRVWVVVDGKTHVGFLAIDVANCYLSQLFVDINYQRQGVGVLLLNQAKSECATLIRLHTLQRNTKACNFYEKHGFVKGEVGTNKLNGQPNVMYVWKPITKIGD
ncbi:MAG: GNAT family N-acetyltransferase [Chloroflexota bacterium]